ncbi:hypothetical protein Scep_014889 [Stephania cephalantha]|uniref:Helicase-associated domain-containing protein n=1 Tax=Stephania cephalantha TaxID=152367 RepID=A0AAP0J266_9MAGN
MIYDAMPQYQLLEILQTSLQELCLHIKSLHLGAALSFLAKALQPSDPLSVQNAIELLKTIGPIDDMEELTPRGRHLRTLPLDPHIGKMLLIRSIFQCLNPALTIVSALAYRDPYFFLPINRKEDADAAKKSFARNSYSDDIALLKAFDSWMDAKRNGRDRSFCWDNFFISCYPADDGEYEKPVYGSTVRYRLCQQKQRSRGEAKATLTNQTEMNVGQQSCCENLWKVGFLGESFGEEVIDGGRALPTKLSSDCDDKVAVVLQIGFAVVLQIGCSN